MVLRHYGMFIHTPPYMASSRQCWCTASARFRCISEVFLSSPLFFPPYNLISVSVMLLFGLVVGCAYVYIRTMRFGIISHSLVFITLYWGNVVFYKANQYHYLCPFIWPISIRVIDFFWWHIYLLQCICIIIPLNINSCSSV